MSDRVTQAVWAGIAGHTLGATQTGRKSFKRLAFYEPGPLRMSPSPTFDAWLAFDRYVSSGEGPDGLWRDVAEHWVYATPASAVARANRERGVPVPCSGALSNPYRNDASALGRAAFWGLAFQGRPTVAADWAFWDASYDHAEEGVWTAVALAASVASAVEGAALSDVLRAATSALDPRSKGAKMVSAVLQAMGEPEPLPGLKTLWDGEYGHGATNQALPAFGASLAGVAVAKDAATAVTGAVGFGGASDQCGLVAGVLGALLYGPIAPEWTGPLGDAYVSGHGLKSIEPPATLTDFVALVCAAQEKAAPLGAWRPAEDAEAAVTSRGLRLEARFPSGPIDRGHDGWQAAVTLRNDSDEVVEVEAQVSGPEGSETATRLGHESLGAREAVTKGLVIKRAEGAKDSSVTVHAGSATLRLPVLAPQRWMVAGPFENESQDAYEATLPAERRQAASDRFNGRSGLQVQWTEWLQVGRVFDVEPLFQFGPGAVVLWGRFHLPSSGPVKVLAAGAPGVSVTVDGQRLLRYNDYHAPEPVFQSPYIAELTPGSETTVMIKLVRDRRPAHPFFFMFVDAEGRIVEPVDWRPMDP